MPRNQKPAAAVDTITTDAGVSATPGPAQVRILESKPKPDAAGKALASLKAASEQAWTQYRDTGGPQFIFSFSGDPELVRAVTTAWPDRDEESDWILRTLEETL
jgi:hypothetical protein